MHFQIGKILIGGAVQYKYIQLVSAVRLWWDTIHVHLFNLRRFIVMMKVMLESKWCHLKKQRSNEQKKFTPAESTIDSPSLSLPLSLPPSFPISHTPSHSPNCKFLLCHHAAMTVHSSLLMHHLTVELTPSSRPNWIKSLKNLQIFSGQEGEVWCCHSGGVVAIAGSEGWLNILCWESLLKWSSCWAWEVAWIYRWEKIDHYN